MAILQSVYAASLSYVCLAAVNSWHVLIRSFLLGNFRPACHHAGMRVSLVCLWVWVDVCGGVREGLGWGEGWGWGWSMCVCGVWVEWGEWGGVEVGAGLGVDGSR